MYSRAGTHNGNYGLMYAVFLPRQQQKTWLFPKGHRFSWQTAVLWTYSENDPRPYAIRYTNDGAWETSFSWATSIDGHPVIGSKYNTLFTDVGGNQGKQLPLVEWQDIPPPAQASLENMRWGDRGDQYVRFNQQQFDSAMADAWVAPPQ